MSAEPTLTRAGYRDSKTGGEAGACLESIRQEMSRRGLDISLGGVRRLYTVYLRREARGEFLPWVLTYLDPTGEQAVHNMVGGASA